MAQKKITNIKDEAFTIDQLKTKQGLMYYLGHSRKHFNWMLDKLVERNLIEPHKGKRVFSNKELKIILKELDGTDLDNAPENTLD